MASYTAQGLWLKATPILFVLLWSTGFIGAKYGLPYAEPYTFLFVRFVCVLAVLFVLIQFLNERWPRSLRLWLHIG